MSQDTKQNVWTRVKTEKVKAEVKEGVILVSANTLISKVIGKVQNSLKDDKKVTIRSIGQMSGKLFRIMEIVQRVNPCHVVVRQSFFKTQDKFVCDKKEIEIPRLKPAVEIDFTIDAPKDTSVEGYMAPFTEEQVEATQRKSRRRYDNRSSYRYQRRGPRRRFNYNGPRYYRGRRY